MQILALSDIHTDWGRFSPTDLPPAHLALVAGDLTEWGVRRDACEMERAADWLAAMGRRYPRVLWIPGNHDIGIREETFPRMPNVECILNKTVSVLAPDASGGQVTVHGVSLSPAYDLPELAAHYDHMTVDPVEEARAYDFGPADIVLSHCPPRGTLDRWPADDAQGPRPIGSPALAAHIARHSPRLVVCGHVHEAQGEAVIGPTRVYNVARSWALIDL